jgi:hypothetical protein
MIAHFAVLVKRSGRDREESRFSAASVKKRRRSLFEKLLPRGV